MKQCIIINADDCGMSQKVNQHIERAINAAKITSTTVIANMDDFEGAVKLYKKYGLQISFGWHINLTEGMPLLYSQQLLDIGFYKETPAGVVMDARKFMHKWLPSSIRSEIKKELMAQYMKLRDSGINISHIDSHHHVHTSIWAIGIIPSIIRETGIKRMRCIFNNKPLSLDVLMRRGWALMIKSQTKGLKMPDVLSGFELFVNKGIITDGNVVELECHPGHPKFKHEEAMLMNISLEVDYKLINYLQI